MSNIISSINNRYSNTTVKPSSKVHQDIKVSETETPISSEDKFVKSEPNISVTYNKNMFKGNVGEKASENTDVTSVDSLLQQQEDRKLKLLEMIRDTITKQAGKFNGLGNLNININISIEISPVEGTTGLENDDEWGIDAVADRIMSMAESFVGEDSSMFATIKQAVLDGFADAEKKWGGELPQICQDTMKEIENRFDKWEKELFGTEE